MDTSEATRIVMSRVQTFDPENASKIMGYVLIQDQGEKEMIRLAFSPDALLLSYINQAKIGLGISSNTSSASPFSHHFPQTSPRLIVPNNGFNLSSSPSSSPNPLFNRSRPRPISYPSGSPNLHFHGVGDFGDVDPVMSPSGVGDFGDVDPVMSPSGDSDSVVFSYGEDGNGVVSPHPFHRRGFSVNDAAFLDDGNGGNGWPCMYFARGFCKNGGACKFLHGDVDAIDVGSPSFDELLKLKAMQQQRFSFLMSESPRNEFSQMGTSSSRQIYLTFPADSTFREDDVSGYFSAFGPVQDVRIPYQQKRMFGFVTFVFPETVKLILAKGNPHFVCDSRVLVKPYKEKGKIREKKHHLERGEYSSSLGIDSSDHFGQPFGPRMLLSPRELRLRKLEWEVELQHAIELQGQRMMNLQLRDLNHNPHYLQSFPSAVPFSSPRQSQLLMNQHSSHSINKEDSEESDGADEKGNLLNQGNADDFDPHESMDHILPDNLFASPTKSAAENPTIFNRASAETEAEADDGLPVSFSSSNNTPLLTSSSPLTVASLKSCYLQMPWFSSAQEVVEM